MAARSPAEAGRESPVAPPGATPAADSDVSERSASEDSEDERRDRLRRREDRCRERERSRRRLLRSSVSLLEERRRRRPRREWSLSARCKPDGPGTASGSANNSAVDGTAVASRVVATPATAAEESRGIPGTVAGAVTPKASCVVPRDEAPDSLKKRLARSLKAIGRPSPVPPAEGGATGAGAAGMTGG